MKEKAIIDTINYDAKHLLDLWTMYLDADGYDKEQLELFITNRIQMIIQDTERSEEE